MISPLADWRSVQLRNCGRYGKCYVTPDGTRYPARMGCVHLSVCLELAQAETPEIFGLVGFIKSLMAGKADYMSAFAASRDLLGSSPLQTANRVRVNYALIREQWLTRSDQRDGSLQQKVSYR